VGLLARNLRPLIDLQLRKVGRHKILTALVMDFDTYEGVGNIYYGAAPWK